MENEAPLRRHVGLHVLVAAICGLTALYGERTLCPRAIWIVMAAFAGGMNAGVAIEYSRTKGLPGWKEEKLTKPTADIT